MDRSFRTVKEAAGFIGKRQVHSTGNKLIRAFGQGDHKRVIFAFGKLVDNGGEVFAEPVTHMQTCREQLCNFVSLRHCGKKKDLTIHRFEPTLGILAKSKLEPEVAYNYIDTGAGVLLVLGGSFEKLKKNLHVIHRYEKLARNGRSCVYEVDHDYRRLDYVYDNRLRRYKYVYGSRLGIPCSMVLFPQFWFSSVPLMSAFTLLVRILMSVDLPKNVGANWVSELPTNTCGRLKTDINTLKGILGKEPESYRSDVISNQCRSWRRLSRRLPKKMTNSFCGVFGTLRLSNALNKLKGVKGAKKRYSNVPKDYRPYLDEIEVITRRNKPKVKRMGKDE